MMALSPAERTKLINILGMLGSDQVGERANAGSLATNLVRRHGLTWADVVLPVLPSGQEPPRQHRPAGEAAVQHNVRFCLRYLQHLTTWEQGFVNSVANRPKVSDKQANILRQAADKLRSRGFA